MTVPIELTILLYLLKIKLLNQMQSQLKIKTKSHCNSMILFALIYVMNKHKPHLQNCQIIFPNFAQSSKLELEVNVWKCKFRKNEVAFYLVRKLWQQVNLTVNLTEKYSKIYNASRFGPYDLTLHVYPLFALDWFAPAINALFSFPCYILTHVEVTFPHSSSNNMSMQSY